MKRRGKKCFSDILAGIEAMLYIIYPEKNSFTSTIIFFNLVKNGVKIVFYFWFPTSFFNVGLRTGEFSLVLDEDRVVVPSSQMQQGKDKGTNMTKMSQISQSGSNQGKVYVHNTSPLKPPQGRGEREDYCAPDSKSMALQLIPHSSLVIPHPSHGEETPPGTPQNTGSVCLQVRSHL